MAVDHNNPQSRTEEILIATIDGEEYDKLPQSRLEELLLELKQVIEAGGGGGGTTNYNNLSNKPQVNGITLSGDKSASDLSLVLAEVGKGLSTNDYSDEEKAKVANLLTAIEGILTGSDIDSFGDVETALSAIKDGTEIDSFGDVEVALLDKADTSDLGTAAAKDSTNAVTSGSTDLVESGAVKDAIDAAVAAAYHHAGTKTVAQLTHDLLIAANEGNVYNITDSGTTTSDFIEGIGKPIDAGDNVGICKVGDVYMFDLLSGLEDTSIFVQKSQTAGLLNNDGTVNTTIESTVAGNTAAIATKQPITDNTLQTTDKTIPGAINEVKSGLTNVADDVKLNTQDLTTPSRSKNVINILDKESETINGVTAVCSGGVITLTGESSGDAEFYFSLGTPLVLDPTLYKIAFNNTATNQYMAIRFRNSSTTLLNWAPNVENRIVENWQDSVICDRVSIAIPNGYFTEMSISITVLDKTTTDATFAPYIPSVESRIEAVEAMVESYTLTPATYITINRASCVKIDNTVIVDAVVTFGADKSASSALLYGIPAIGNTNIPIYSVDDNATARPVRLYNNGVFTSGAFTASEKIHIMGSYTLTN